MALSSSNEDSSCSLTPKPKKSYCGLKSQPRVSQKCLLLSKERRGRRVSLGGNNTFGHPVWMILNYLSEDPSTLQPAMEPLLLMESSEPVSQLHCSQEEGGPFKIPIKETMSMSSSPSKSLLSRTPESRRLIPPAKVGELDFSPVQTPRVPLAPCQTPWG